MCRVGRRRAGLSAGLATIAVYCVVVGVNAWVGLRARAGAGRWGVWSCERATVGDYQGRWGGATLSGFAGRGRGRRVGCWVDLVAKYGAWGCVRGLFGGTAAALRPQGCPTASLAELAEPRRSDQILLDRSDEVIEARQLTATLQRLATCDCAVCTWMCKLPGTGSSHRPCLCGAL